MRTEIEKEARRVFGVATTVHSGTSGARNWASLWDGPECIMGVARAESPFHAERRLLEALRGMRALGPKHSPFFERLFDKLGIRLGGQH